MIPASWMPLNDQIVRMNITPLHLETSTEKGVAGAQKRGTMAIEVQGGVKPIMSSKDDLLKRALWEIRKV